jgi:general secretion pathway protein H
MVLTGVRAVKDLQPISRTGIIKPNGASSGFMLLDMALALTILVLLFAIVWPNLGRGTTSFQQSAVALDVANVLRSDRTSATLSATSTSTQIDLERRTVTGAQGHRVTIPNDVALEVTTGSACVSSARRFVIVFSADGTSCGGMIVLKKRSLAYVVRFNWLSGMIDVFRRSNG